MFQHAQLFGNSQWKYQVLFQTRSNQVRRFPAKTTGKKKQGPIAQETNTEGLKTSRQLTRVLYYSYDQKHELSRLINKSTASFE